MLGMRISNLRKQQNMSQQELAKAICVSASAIGMYEQGRREPPLDRLLAIAKLFGVSTDYLLTGIPHTEEDTHAAATFIRMLQDQMMRPGALQSLREKDLRLYLIALLGA